MDIKNYRKEEIFVCHSIHLFYFLKLNGFRYEYRDYNPKTNKAIWMFKRTPELLDAVSAYSDGKNK